MLRDIMTHGAITYIVPHPYNGFPEGICHLFRLPKQMQCEPESCLASNPGEFGNFIYCRIEQLRIE